MNGEPIWISSAQLAWAEHDGPGRPPQPSTAPWFVLSGVLASVFAGMVATDVLCPEHRAMVVGLGSLAFAGTIVSAVALARRWASAPLITLLSATAGIGIGVIDAVHDPVRGTAVAVAFGACVLGGGVLLVKQLRLRTWDEHVTAAVAPLASVAEPAIEPVAPPARGPVGEPVHR